MEDGLKELKMACEEAKVLAEQIIARNVQVVQVLGTALDKLKKEREVFYNEGN